ncbi:MAG: cardiolipin synthase [Bacillota bacterium]|nr:cardiolipin synthase [Bacillota bacterium]
MRSRLDLAIKFTVYTLSFVALCVLAFLYLAGFFDNLSFENPGLDLAYRVFMIVFRLNIIWVVLLILLENSNPAKTLAWVGVLVLLPVIGFFLYIWFGRSFRKKRRADIKARKHSDRMEKAASYQLELLNLSDIESPTTERLMNLLLRSANAPYSDNNQVTVISDGAEKFEALFQAIEQAEHHIHLEYYILRDDEIGNRLADRLVRKAEQGVEVRIVFDDVGSIMLSHAYRRKLQEAGVELYPFFEVLFPALSRDLNYRNHRKIAIVDGKIGFIGGFNVGDEYLGKSKRFGYWRDTHLMIRGEAVLSLQSIFLDDWNYVAKQNLTGSAYFPKIDDCGNCMVQVVASGPDYRWKSMHHAFHKLIADAKEKLWITSPYLVPDESISMALKVAALSGVDVRIIIPKNPDHFFVYWSGQSNIQELLEAGVRIYAYGKGFVHSKVMICDRSIATVGTANLDMRSMEINFEVNAFVYDEDVILRLEQDFHEDLKVCEKYDLEIFRRRGIDRRFLEAIGRIVSPLQ